MAKKKPLDPKVEEALEEESSSLPVDSEEEKAARFPLPVQRHKFNPRAIVPYDCTVEHIYLAMNEFVEFLGFINQELGTKDILRFESLLMPANFSSMVGEFMSATIPKYCPSLAKNQYHNGHPDMVPRGMFPRDSIQHSTSGIEIKGSRYARGWQGHNPEDCWLIVFVFDSNRPKDHSTGVPPRPFRFRSVYLGQLTKEDWLFSGRSGESRRTITASVTRSGFEKMTANWIYNDNPMPGAVDLSQALESSE